MSGYITAERARDPEFLLAAFYDLPLPGVEPGSAEDAELREFASDAMAMGDAAPPMTRVMMQEVAAILDRERSA